MVTGDVFDEQVAIVFKQEEVPHVIQKLLRIEEAANDFLQLVFARKLLSKPLLDLLDAEKFPCQCRIGSWGIRGLSN